MLKKLLIGLLFVLHTPIVFSQVFETSPPDHIKTITFKGNTPESQLPVIRLGDPLVLEFDALNAKEEDFYYIIQHCNYDWTPSILAKTEYLRGIDNQRISTYENSFNTYEIYSHYTLTIPNTLTRGFLKSGNYMIFIYDDFGELMFSRKFMIYEDIASVGAVVKRTRDMNTIQERQTVNFVINSGRINFNNPMETVKALVVQNNNLNTAIINLKPQYILGNELEYRYSEESAFWGGNEYLYFENRDVRVGNVGIQFIDLKDIYNSYLFTQEPRKGREYTYNPDINGNFKITVIDSRDTRTEADYTMVHFSLRMPELPPNEAVFIYGNYNSYAIDNSNRMIYNSDRGMYECSMKLKQGFYNYKYVIVDSEGYLNEGGISGNYWQTENNYKILVYYRDLGARFDRLVGFGETTSVNITN
ncbi:type IX secretion system plug protein [Winogradskyella aurantiaca]|uniref:type IX secretion system plug protein n=1 Tax=Winogradskyella aurantiaca TaxID=2219558 RepID=UPI000E1E1FBB|nr:DUF5103 domain-containing protein [Winogradskyella aurantiaca]